MAEQPSTMSIQLIAGLGNPGAEYEHTRHNVGADLVRTLANQYQGSLQASNKFFGESATITIDGQALRLIIPSTYMNLSGQSVGAIAHFYKIPPEAVLVVHDELDLSPGVARFKKGGGHGGHNGLRDIIKAFGNNNDFARLRIGIGHPGNAKLVSHFVLSKAPSNEQTMIDNAISRSIQCLPTACKGNWEIAMQELHSQT